MIRVAFYGKGGIGKSTTVSNVAAALAQQGLRVLQIGCDPKADSTIDLRHGQEQEAILSLIRSKKPFTLEQMVSRGFAGVYCAETGGPLPGLGCAGRGVITALERLREAGADEVIRPDVVLYDVLGDVVCGGFAMPMRRGWADQVYILTSGENMSIHAAANIAMAVENFAGRGYASLGGLILNRRGVKNEEAKVAELAEDVHSEVVAALSHDLLVPEAQERHQVLLEAFPDSAMAGEYRTLAQTILERA